MLELFIDLILVLMRQDKLPIKSLETLALAFDVDNDWNCKNKDQAPMGRWQIAEGRQSQEQIEYARVTHAIINNYGWLCDLINRFGDGHGFEMVIECLSREDITCKGMAALLQPLGMDDKNLNQKTTTNFDRFSYQKVSFAFDFEVTFKMIDKGAFSMQPILISDALICSTFWAPYHKVSSTTQNSLFLLSS